MKNDETGVPERKLERFEKGEDDEVPIRTLDFGKKGF